MTCSGASSSQCLSCSEGSYHNSSSQTCQKCSRFCKTCSGPAENQCLTCLPSFLLGNSSCSCPVNTYLNQQLFQCAMCASTCRTCTGPRFNECESCGSERILVNRTCRCPEHYFEIERGGCVMCANFCRTCWGRAENNCRSCKNNMVLSRNSTCVCQESNFFIDTTNFTCRKCDDFCLTCEGPLNGNCLSCPNDKLLVNGSCVCGKQSSLNKISGVCEKCETNCLECNGPTECVKCVNRSQSVFSGKCVDQCFEGYYSDNNKICKECGGFCKECDSQRKCIACFEGYRLLSNCTKTEEITVKIETTKNPKSFKLVFSVYCENLMRDLNKIVSVVVIGGGLNYSYSIITHDKTAYIKMNYNESFEEKIFAVNLTIQNYSDNASKYFFKRNHFKIPLEKYINCQEPSYYDESTIFIIIKNPLKIPSRSKDL